MNFFMKDNFLKWSRRVQLFVFVYEALGSLLGGTLLILAPDGRYMQMPVDIMHGVFLDFFIPGVILFVLGILNAAAFFEVIRRERENWFVAIVVNLCMLIWFWVEIAIIEEVHWLHAMWGLPVVAGLTATLPFVPSLRSRLLRPALASGIIASLLYVLINVIVAVQWGSYDSAAQTVSELSAIDAPTRMLWIVLCIPYTLLTIAFAWGIRESAGDNRKLKIAGNLLIAYGLLGVLWPFFPMHLRETLAAGGGTLSDTLHIALGIITEVLFLLSLGFAAAALGRGFRMYSIGTVVLLIVFAILTFVDAPKIALNQPTPLVGVWERINIGLFLLWTCVLSYILQRKALSTYDKYASAS